MHPAGYVFGSAGIVNQTGGWNTGIAFLFGLLSVQWTVCQIYLLLSFSHTVTCEQMTVRIHRLPEFTEYIFDLCFRIAGL